MQRNVKPNDERVATLSAKLLMAVALAAAVAVAASLLCWEGPSSGGAAPALSFVVSRLGLARSTRPRLARGSPGKLGRVDASLPGGVGLGLKHKHRKPGKNLAWKGGPRMRLAGRVAVGRLMRVCVVPCLRPPLSCHRYAYANAVDPYSLCHRRGRRPSAPTHACTHSLGWIQVVLTPTPTPTLRLYFFLFAASPLAFPLLA